MEKEVIVNDKKFKVRELLATELDVALELTDKKESLRKQITLSTGITDDEYAKLTVKERMQIVVAMNEVNGIGDFQKSSN